MVEKQISGCNANVITNYERQYKLEQDLNERRDTLLKKISDGKEDMYGSGSGLGFNKKNSSGKRGGGDHYGSMAGNFLSGFKKGFL